MMINKRRRSFVCLLNLVLLSLVLIVVIVVIA